MSLAHDDSMWYVIIVNEFYDDRLRNRLLEIDKVASNAADKALVKIAEAVNEKADSITIQKNRGFLWRSWGLLLSMMVVLCSVVLNAGYVMGSGKYPFWLNPSNSYEQIISWFLNVPAGWIFLLGSSPFLAEVFFSSLKAIRLGMGRKDLLIIKAISALIALLLVVLVTLAF